MYSSISPPPSYFLPISIILPSPCKSFPSLMAFIFWFIKLNRATIWCSLVGSSMLDKWWQWLPFSQNLTVSHSSAVRVDPLTFLLHPYLISYGIPVQSISVVEFMITIVVPCPGDSVLQFFPLSFGSYLTPQCFLSCRGMVYISCLGLSSHCHLFLAPWVAVSLRIQHCLLERGAFLIMSGSKIFCEYKHIYWESNLMLCCVSQSQH